MARHGRRAGHAGAGGIGVRRPYAISDDSFPDTPWQATDTRGDGGVNQLGITFERALELAREGAGHVFLGQYWATYTEYLADGRCRDAGLRRPVEWVH